jgi:hypothetical protein
MRCRLDDLKPGMILSADLREPGGRMLLPSATELTDRHLRYFQMWGVADAEIEGDETQAAAAVPIDPRIRVAVEARVDSLFRHADRGHPAVAQVHAYVLARELRGATTSTDDHGV